MYLFSDFMRLIMRYIIRYRVKVMRSNLVRVFPDKDKREINIILNQSYKILIDNIIEGIKIFSMRKSQIVRRHKLLNPELLDRYFKENRSVIGVTAHYNNWEWGSLSASLQTPYNVAALYKPLSNKIIDNVLRSNRSRCGTELISIYNTSKVFEECKDKPYVYLMAADQSPSSRELPKAYWKNFLGVNTAFLHGLEKHAKNYNYVVVYIDIQKVKRGFYELTLSVLDDNPNLLKDGELTEKYVRKLESVINNNPANWLWSHKRWKHNK